MTSDANAKASRIFLTHSPYHCLLAYAIAVDDEVPSLLCYRPYYPRAQAHPFFKFLQSLDVFVECHLLASMYKYRNTWKRPLSRMPAKHRNFTRMRSLIQRHPIKEVCGVLDDRDLTQFVMQTATKQFERPVRCSIIEDGEGIYIPLITRKRWTPYILPSLHTRLHRWMYGYSYQPPPSVGFYGDFELVDRLYAHAPAYVADRYSEHDVVEIPAWPLRAIDPRSIRNLFAQSGLDDSQLGDVDGVILEPFINDCAATTKFERLVCDIAAEGVEIAFKPHPRVGEYNGNKYQQFTTIPPHIPVELIFLMASQLSFVLGKKSTALLTSNWISQNILPISGMIILDNHKPNTNYHERHIYYPHSKSDLLVKLADCVNQ